MQKNVPSGKTVLFRQREFFVYRILSPRKACIAPVLSGYSIAEVSTMKKHKKKLETQPLTHFQAEKTDPQGSYTGVPADIYEVPVQDADDL